MSQRALETALGRLICDEAFRKEFYKDAEGTALRAGFQLTPIELICLHNIELGAIEAFVSHVDDRVRRAAEEPAGTPPAETDVRGRPTRSHGGGEY